MANKEKSIAEIKSSDQPESLRYTGYTTKEMQFFSSDKQKILIIKLGAMGDVLRTTPILLSLKKRYPDSIIYWLTKEESLGLLSSNPLIDKLLTYNTETILRLIYEKFDIMFNFEIDTPATFLANLTKAEQKYGYYFNEKGFTSCFNKSSENYLNIAFNDELKKQNKKSYQELMHDVAELQFETSGYMLSPSEYTNKYAQNFKQKNNISDSDIVIGINIASGSRWKAKLWSKDKVIELISLLSKNNKIKILLLGGKTEEDYINDIIKKLNQKNILKNDQSNTVEEFIGMVSLCDVAISTDSLALHISLALKKPTIALFFCTIPNEIKDEKYLIKLTSPLLEKYFYENDYSDELANSISAQEVFEGVKNLSSF